MSVRESLLRQHRWQLEERQQFLAGLEALAERLRADALRLEREIAESRGRLPLDEADLPPLLQPLVERQHRIQHSITEVEAQIAEARALVAEAVQEVERSAAAVQAQPERIPGRVGRPRRRGRPHFMHGTIRQNNN
jgi:F0F1-type ATP synthase membrane subunit b/b'